MTGDETPNPLGNWRDLLGATRREWWQRLWQDTIALADRYRLPLRSGWWTDSLQVEALAALAEWVRFYDTGTYQDPDGKLKLLWQLEPIAAALRAGDEPFDAHRDYPRYQRHIAAVCDPPNGLLDASSDATTDLSDRRRGLTTELDFVVARLHELSERQALLSDQPSDSRGANRGATPVADERAHIERTIGRLRRRRRELHCQLDEICDPSPTVEGD